MIKGVCSDHMLGSVPTRLGPTESQDTIMAITGVSPQPRTWIVRVMGPGPSRLLGSLGLKRVSSSLMKGGLST